jgi:type VI secretion system FHA domain protein
MLLALSIISSQGAALGPTAYKVFDARGGSIGRLDGNDWVLPDPEKFVSSRHATVRWGGDGFYLEDVSSNGTFINAPDRPVPRTQPLRLQDGDRLFIGDYEIIVQLIDSGPSVAAPPVPPPPIPQPLVTPQPSLPEQALGLGTVDPLAALGGAQQAAPAPTPFASAPAAGIGQAASGSVGGIPDDWQVTRFNQPKGAAAAQSAPQPTPPSAAPLAAAPGAAAVAGAPDLLAALGLDPAQVDPAMQQQLGVILRIAVQGLIEVLKSRAQVKNSFRMPMTSIRPVENNPLKFSMNAQDAVYNLFVKRNPGYLGAVEAFEEGFQDIEFHQTAVLAGIRAAFNAMLAKFHPDNLEELYERKLKRTAMLGLGSRLKYWELYRAQFEEIDRDREAHFQLLFGEEFAKAYNEHLQKLAGEARLRKRRDAP